MFKYISNNPFIVSFTERLHVWQRLAGFSLFACYRLKFHQLQLQPWGLRAQKKGTCTIEVGCTPSSFGSSQAPLLRVLHPQSQVPTARVFAANVGAGVYPLDSGWVVRSFETQDGFSVQR